MNGQHLNLLSPKTHFFDTLPTKAQINCTIHAVYNYITATYNSKCHKCVRSEMKRKDKEPVAKTYTRLFQAEWRNKPEIASIFCNPYDFRLMAEGWQRTPSLTDLKLDNVCVKASERDAALVVLQIDSFFSGMREFWERNYCTLNSS